MWNRWNKFLVGHYFIFNFWEGEGGREMALLIENQDLHPLKVKMDQFQQKIARNSVFFTLIAI